MRPIRKLLLAILLLVPISAFALFDDCKDLFPGQEIPTSPQIGRDLCFDSFAIYYSPLDKKPIYTLERLSRDSLTGQRPRRSNQFYEEARLPFAERAQLSDYRGSGFDRGHNAPAGDMSTDRSMAQSFSLANMMPQARQNNQGIWAKNVEEPTRLYAKRIPGEIYVYTGSVGNAGSIGKGKVTIPTHLYKLVYDPAKNSAWAYWIENTNEANMTPPISYQELMQKTGIDFHLPISQNPTATKPTDVKPNVYKASVGAWYPLFFDQYDFPKLNGLMTQIKEGKVASVQIQYDRNLSLAQKVASEIQSQTSIQIILIQSSPPESLDTQYERDRVTAIVNLK